MKQWEADKRWRRLLDLLAPVHDQALATARRLSRTSDEGEDLFHDAVMRAYQKLPALRDEDRFRPWFYAVLLTRHRSRARRGFWRRFLPLEDELEQGREPRGEDGSRWEERRLRSSRVARALATLPAVQREAIVLHDVDGFTIQEIARIQGCSQSAVKSRLSRGRKKLRHHYERIGFGPAPWGAAGIDKEERDERVPLRCARTST